MSKSWVSDEWVVGVAPVIGAHRHLLNGEHLNGGPSYARGKAAGELMSSRAIFCAELRPSSGTVHERIMENSEVIEVTHE